MEQLIHIFQALSDEARVRILNLLFEVEELCVCDIQSILGFSQPKASRHLAYLKHAGLVKDRRHGLWMIYSLNISDNETRHKIIKELRDVFTLSSELQKDLEKLHKNINTGCCTTFRDIFPERLMAILSASKHRLKKAHVSYKR